MILRECYTTSVMKKVIISDFFGVISDECAPVFFKKYVTSQGYNLLTDKYFHPGDRGEIRFEDIVNNVHNDFGFDKERLKKEFLDRPAPHTEYIELLRKLKNEGHRILLLSNTCDTIVPYLLNKFGIDDLFDHLYLSYQIKKTKPSLEIFRYLLKEEKLAPRDCIFIDDNPTNIDASLQVGMHGILFHNDKETLELIEHLAKE
ncbi:MAG TPA: hypothetical protein DD384_00620 [Firmicutes bacterium]|nr:hypothetical protein [Bacillota bacterium]